MDRIYGDSEHPMTEIGLEAAQIYARLVVARGRTVQILETWLDQPRFRRSDYHNKLTSHCPIKLVLYER